MTALQQIRYLMKSQRFERALAALEKVLKREQECPYLWILRGDLIQLLERKDGPPLREAAASYSKALKLNPNNLEAIESLAHFYDAVDPKPVMAKRYAGLYVKKAMKSLSEMKRVLTDE
jgi:tetratricopeptide (TPR) repeat protein